MEKKKTPTIQLQIMKIISAIFWGLLFLPDKKRRGPALNTELLTYWRCCFRSKIKASEVGVPFSIIDKTVATNPLVVRDGVVSAGIQMDEIDHVGEGLEQSLEKVHWKKKCYLILKTYPKLNLYFDKIDLCRY